MSDGTAGPLANEHRRRAIPLSACWPSKGGMDECCHNCRWHSPDLGHPTYKPGTRVTQRLGWVCLAPEFDGVISNWPAHGLCEMWDADARSGVGFDG